MASWWPLAFSEMRFKFVFSQLRTIVTSSNGNAFHTTVARWIQQSLVYYFPNGVVMCRFDVFYVVNLDKLISQYPSDLRWHITQKWHEPYGVSNNLQMTACLIDCSIEHQRKDQSYWLPTRYDTKCQQCARHAHHDDVIKWKHYCPFVWGIHRPLVNFPHKQRPVTLSFDVFFGQRLNKRSNKQSRCRWSETLSRPL